jgi:uncharacterized protein DUF1559
MGFARSVDVDDALPGPVKRHGNPPRRSGHRNSDEFPVPDGALLIGRLIAILENAWLLASNRGRSGQRSAGWRDHTSTHNSGSRKLSAAEIEHDIQLRITMRKRTVAARWRAIMLLGALGFSGCGESERTLDLKARRKVIDINLAMHWDLDASRARRTPENFAFPIAICDANGHKLLSWRVRILPYLGQDALYKKFHLNEPWDSPHNVQMIAEMPEAFVAPGGDARLDKQGKTRFLAISGDETVFGKNDVMLYSHIPDGPSRTIWLVVVDPDQAVEWTKPQDWKFDPNDPFHGMGKSGRLAVGVCDGIAQCFAVGEITPDAFKAWVTPNGGETLSWEAGRVPVASPK